jgi:D-amino-acid dehydrogenase
MSAPSVVVVGGGLIGLTSALFLRQAGADVTVLDVDTLGSGASRGNAGFFSPTIAAPLAGPGVVWSSLRSMLDPTSPLRIRPRALPGLAGWAVDFMKACTASRFEQGRAAMARLNHDLEPLLTRLEQAGVAVHRSPELLVAVHDRAFADHVFTSLQPMAQHGLPIPVEVIDGDAMRALMPALTDHVTAGIVLPADRSVDPRRYVETAIEACRSAGVELVDHHGVTRFDRSADTVRAVVANGRRFEAEHVVLAAGAGIRPLGRLLDLSIPVVPGQGYTVALPVSEGLRQPVIVEEVHAVATPFNDQIRLGGTMEFAGQRPGFDPRRVEAVVTSMRRYLDLDWDARHDAWAGSRPMSADGLPLIGRPRRYRNVVVAGGHGMYGLTLAPATAQAVAELIVDGRARADLSAFDPDR